MTDEMRTGLRFALSPMTPWLDCRVSCAGGQREPLSDWLSAKHGQKGGKNGIQARRQCEVR